MARRGYSLLFATGLFLSDILCVLFGYCLTFYLRFHYYTFLPFLPPPSEIPFFSAYAQALPIVIFVMILCFYGGGLYRESLSFRRIIRIGNIAKQIFYWLLILTALSSLYRNISFSRVFILLLFPLTFFPVVMGRWALIHSDLLIRKWQGKIRKIVIVGDGEILKKLSAAFRMNHFPGYFLEGYVSIRNALPQNELSSVPYLGKLDQIEAVLASTKPDEIIIATVNLDHARLTQIISMCDREMIQFYVVPDIFSFLTSKVELTSVGGINLLGIQKFPLDNGLHRLAKRLLDMTGSLFALSLLSWLFILLAFLIKMTSKGPIFYKQVRCREDGREFLMYKFRTMRIDAEKQTGPVWASKEDDRCTRIGSFLRAFNLDELPQIINVLKGEMSLVGPRPERPHFISKFKFDIPRYMSRHSIKPGMTGWAQVNGLRGNTSLEERVKFDIYYIENWSLWLDIKILFLTFFSYKNAY